VKNRRARPRASIEQKNLNKFIALACGRQAAKVFDAGFSAVWRIDNAVSTFCPSFRVVNGTRPGPTGVRAGSLLRPAALSRNLLLSGAL
jgi:hypothetical protein